MTTPTPRPNDYLAKKNPHPRDQHIHFEEGPHKYTIQGIPGITEETEFTSVTTWVHQHFEHFDAKKVIAAMMRNTKKWNDPIANAKYYGKTAEEIEEMWTNAGQEASTKGTEMHYNIECFYNTPPRDTDPAPNDIPHHQVDAVDSDCKLDITAETAHVSTPPSLGGGTPGGTPGGPPSGRSLALPYCPPSLGGGTPLEFQYFLNFNNEYVANDTTKTLRPYRTEWTVFHEEARIAGSIDMVYEVIEEPGVLTIYDWKRCREITKTNRANKYATHPAIEHLPDTNFWHYALQLNIYKYILQTKYDKTIGDLYLIVLHPEAKNYQRVKLPDLQTEVSELFDERGGSAPQRRSAMSE